ncbi:uncharacterized protein K489DRAFT_378069 [Dissoconium aciculare CBS 342.82]|uniref:Uncharacterized protein n=1 Tax=Dissoconium aciculare CBS 342.82 TaxID=1314786 RepID=A0A6J3MCC3_9PEZI|nr:uncharacterized protein K489DRAFT_378069 [Dissoconium aciculare CBS 342.82]KAF1825528.1 hypothetical protein K489DRAFT_378069 [Dissoconium aciculare CBS 342.82]
MHPDYEKKVPKGVEVRTSPRSSNTISLASFRPHGSFALFIHPILVLAYLRSRPTTRG